MPLNEDSESYLIEILASSATDATVVRTLSAATPSITYLAAQQIADFGALSAAVTVRVAQINGTVGYGAPATATL